MRRGVDATVSGAGAARGGGLRAGGPGDRLFRAQQLGTDTATGNDPTVAPFSSVRSTQREIQHSVPRAARANAEER